MPPVVADAPVGNDVEAVKDEWSRIPGRVTVKYNVEEGEYHTTDGVLSMREIDEDLAISFAFSGAFRARLKSNEFGHVLMASPTGIDGIFEGVFRGGYTLEIDEDPVVPIADSVAYVAPAAVEETLGRRDDITASGAPGNGRRHVEGSGARVPAAPRRARAFSLNWHHKTTVLSSRSRIRAYRDSGASSPAVYPPCFGDLEFAGRSPAGSIGGP